MRSGVGCLRAPGPADPRVLPGQASPVSNKIHAAIGFAPVVDMAHMEIV
ncbi:hypothetical protein [Nocardioides sp.]|nr:hypothetical protein [Nocardioides sp.]